MKKKQEQLRAMLVDIYNCASAWDNDDGKMAEANEKTPEDILAGYLEDVKKQTIDDILEELPDLVEGTKRTEQDLTPNQIAYESGYSFCRTKIKEYELKENL